MEASFIRLVALRGHDYDGKWRQEGDSYDAPVAHANALQAVGTCRIVSETDAKKTKHTYQRRDMKADG